MIGIIGNKQINRSNHKGKRKRRNNTHRTPEDWNREYRNAQACIDNNFQDNDPKCANIVAHISNKHIKSVKKAREYVHSFEKSLPSGTVILAFIELNLDHHPHVHMIIKNHKEILPYSVLKSSWTYGSISYIKRSPDHLRNRILKYSIKAYPLDAKLFFNKKAAEKYNTNVVKLQYIINSLKKRRSTLKGDKKVRCRKILNKAYHLQKKYKRLLKAENQKQVLVKDRIVYKTRGMGKNTYQVVTDRSEIKNKLGHAIPVRITSLTLEKYNSNTGEIIDKSFQLQKVTFKEVR